MSDTAIDRLFGKSSLGEAVWALLSSPSQGPGQSLIENMSEIDKLEYYAKLRKVNKAEAEKFAAVTGITTVGMGMMGMGGSLYPPRDILVTSALLARMAELVRGRTINVADGSLTAYLTRVLSVYSPGCLCELLWVVTKKRTDEPRSYIYEYKERVFVIACKTCLVRVTSIFTQALL